MSALSELKDFPLDVAKVQLWVFKKSLRDRNPVFNGHWVETTAELDAAMRLAVANERERITEVHNYSLLAQNNEGSALAIDTIETHGGLVVTQAAAEIPAKKITKLKELQNTEFYAIKLLAGEKVIFAIRKADGSWKTRRALNLISVYFSDQQLGLVSDPGFSIAKNIDFFIVGNEILISSKPNFESVLNYKAAYIEDFQKLQIEDKFKNVFTSLEALLEHIGDNKIQLRRVSAIRQKGHYKDPIFMENLRKNAALFKLSIEFDAEGRIIPTLASCKDIMQALLDHRLQSGFSYNIYDVQDTANVGT